MGSGKAKKARKSVFKNNVSPDSLPPLQRKYINKEISKLVNEFERNTLDKGVIKTLRAFPCQKMKGQFVYLKDTDAPTYNEEDGLWYLNGELLVSEYYKVKELLKQKAEENRKLLEKQKEFDKNVTALKPQTLGDV